MSCIIRTVALLSVLAAPIVSATPSGVYQRRAPLHRRGWDDLAQAWGGTRRCDYTDPGMPISLVAAQAELLSGHSWEFGTAAEALLELCECLQVSIPAAPDPSQILRSLACSAHIRSLVVASQRLRLTLFQACFTHTTISTLRLLVTR